MHRKKRKRQVLLVGLWITLIFFPYCSSVLYSLENILCNNVLLSYTQTGPGKPWQSTAAHGCVVIAKSRRVITRLKLFQETIKMYNAKAFTSQLLL